MLEDAAEVPKNPLPLHSEYQWITVEEFIGIFGYKVLSDITQNYFRCNRGSIPSDHERLVRMVIFAELYLSAAAKTADVRAGCIALVAMNNREVNITIASQTIR